MTTTPSTMAPLPSIMNMNQRHQPQSMPYASPSPTSSSPSSSGTSPRSSATPMAASTTALISKKAKTDNTTTTNMLQVPPRKRSKVSRACDECRRKKIRCDAGTEEEPYCTSCRRAGEKCSFSRIPMKRGPSKRARWDKETSPPSSSSSDKQVSKKSPVGSTRQSISMNMQSEFVLTQAANFATTPTTSSNNNNNHNNNNRLPSIDTLTGGASAALANASNDRSPKHYSINYRHPSISSDSSVEFKRYSEPDEPGWDDRCIDNYYQVVHPALPILPSSKVRLRSRLLSCNSATLRYLLLSGVNGLVKKNGGGDVKQQIQGLLQIASEVRSLNYQAKVLYLTSLVLLFLQTNDAIWLGSAVSLSYDMGLHVAKQQSLRDSEDDANLSRRLFLILVVLDRLHASVKSVPVQIPDSAIHLNPDIDNYCFGPTGVQVIKLCMILGHGASTPSNLLFQELEQAYKSIESMWDTTPILKAMYYLVVVHFDWISIKTTDGVVNNRQILANVISDAGVLITLLESPLISVSPLIGYFIPPLVSTLIDLVSQFPSNTNDPLTQQFWGQMDFLDQVIKQTFPHFEGLRHDISQARMESQRAVSPRSKLEGLAAVANHASNYV